MSVTGSITTGFRDENGVDLGQQLVEKDYLMSVYPNLLPNMKAPQLFSWGQNGYGQVGDNTSINKSSPVQLPNGSSIWRQVSGGVSHAAAIGVDGTLWMWGRNQQGQLGSSSVGHRSSPVQTISYGSNWSVVSTGGNYTASIKSDGTLWSWGLGTSGQLGDSTLVSKSSPVQVLDYSNTWTKIVVGGAAYLGIKSDGTLWGWGQNLLGVLGDNTGLYPTPTNRTSPVQTVALGTNWSSVSIAYTANGDYAFATATKTDGTLWAWGANTYGNLGDNTTIHRSSPVQVIGGATNWKSAVCGTYHTVAIKTDGTLWCWGLNSSGQLGINNTTNISSPVQTIAYGTTWMMAAGGFDCSGAIKSDGTLWTWGSNNVGQLGDNTIINKSSPIQTITFGTNWSYIAQNTNRGLTTYGVQTGAVKSDGTLWTWGAGDYSALGDNTTISRSSPVQTATYSTDWSSITWGADSGLGIKKNGEVWVWGQGAYPFGISGGRSSPVQITSGGSYLTVAQGTVGAGIKTNGTLYTWGTSPTPFNSFLTRTDWSSINLANLHSTAIRKDGTLWTWGLGSSGQLGDFSTATRSLPVQEISSNYNWYLVDAGGTHTAAVQTNGSLWCWGLGTSGQVGDATIVSKSSPVQAVVQTTTWTSSISAGGQATGAAIKTDGTLWLWGSNSYGRLGDNTFTFISKSSPVQTVTFATNWSKVSLGANHAAAVKTDGTLWTWGRNSYGQLGDNTITNRSSPVQTVDGGTTWNAVICGQNHTLATKTDGTLWLWGANSYGQLGVNDISSRSSPIQTITYGTTWSSISAASLGNHSAATKSDGTLWIWGRNSNGQLGDNTIVSKSSPIQVLTPTKTWSTAISGGTAFSAAIKKDSTLWVWGLGTSGQLADNTILSKSSPIQTVTFGTNWSSVSCGATHAAAIKTDGTLWTWGTNTNGQLGDNTITHRSSPVQTVSFGTNWASVACGSLYTAATKTDGTLWTWGRNDIGQLGTNDITHRSSPAQTVAGGTNWNIVSTGSSFIGAIKKDGTLWTWGNNSVGMLGDGTNISKSSPVQTAAFGSNWEQIICNGNFNTVAKKTDGTLWAWGRNSAGTLGDNTVISKSSPIQTISYGNNWSVIAQGYEHIIASKTDGTLWGIGTNFNGELGDGTGIRRSSPIQVAGSGLTWQTDTYSANNILLITGNGTNAAQNNTFVDSSVNNFTITRNGNTTQGNFSPYGKLWSVYFDGNGDYLTIGSNSALAPSTGDLTIEFWINFSSLPSSGNHNGICENQALAAGANNAKFYCSLYNNSGTYWIMLGRHSTSTYAYATWTPTLGVWYHIAVVRQSGTILIFINGIQQTVTNSTSLSGVSFDQNGFTIGAITTPYYGNSYISSFRYIVGTAFYTTSFTPSTTPLLPISGTQLLTCIDNRFLDRSSNNATITKYGDSKISRFCPFTTPGLCDINLMGGSAYFDGTGDYLSIADNSALEIGSNSFTVEAWIYFTGYSAGYSGYYIAGVFFKDASGDRGFDMQIEGTASSWTAISANLFSNNSTYTATSASYTFYLYTWYHIAYVRNGTSLRIYVNGTDIGGGTNSVTVQNTATSAIIGATGYIGLGYEYYFPGYISNFRFINGYAAYTSNFVPPTSPVTAIGGTTLLLNFTNAAIYDGTSTTNLETVGNAQISTSVVKYGSGSVAFDGTGDYLTINPSMEALGAADFTVEFWMYPNATYSGTYAGILDSRTSGNGAGLIYVGYNGTANTIGWYDNTGYVVTGTVTVSTWQHIAFIRSASVLFMYVNGSLVSTGSYTQSLTVPFKFIGSSFDNYAFNGYIDNLRLTKGIARYNGNFTPASLTTSVGIYDSLLLATSATNNGTNSTFVDSSNNNFTITRTGNVTQGTFTPFSNADGYWSNYFDGNGDYLTASDSSAFNMGSGNFTVEGWFYSLTTSGTQTFVSTAQGADTQGFWLGIDAGPYKFYASTDGVTWGLSLSGGTPVANTWNHIAVVRSGSNWTFYLNGVSQSTTTNAGTLTNTNNIIAIGGRTTGGSQYSNSYISNLRIVKGTALYTSNFTVISAPLIRVSGASILTCQSNRFLDNSANAFALTQYGDVKARNFNPFTTSIYNTYASSGSGYFDGSTDYLSIATNSQTAFQSNNFTIEFFAYFTNASANAIQTIYTNYTTWSSGSLFLGKHTSASGAMTFWVNNFSSATHMLADPSLPPGNQWVHYAIVRSGNTFTMYRNGVSVASATYSGAATGSTNINYIGAPGDILGSYNFPGYMSSFRILNGTALYTSNFTVPNAPLTKVYNTQLLLNFNNGQILDYTGRNILETVGDAKVSTSVVKYGSGSMYFDGNGDYLKSAYNDNYDFSTGNFTIEMWIYPTSTNHQSACLFTQEYISNPISISIFLNNGSFETVGNQLGFGVYSGSSWTIAEHGIVTISTNTWTHIALARSGNYFSMYVNGELKRIISNSTSCSLGTNQYLIARRWDTYGSYPYFSGYINQLKVTRGFATYKGNFTPQPITDIGMGNVAWNDVACGNSHSLATKSDGSIYSWGLNTSGQLGNNSLITRSNYVIPYSYQSFGNDWSSVSCGDSHTIAKKTDNTMWSWGLNGNGQLGDNTISQTNLMVQECSLSSNWNFISAGYRSNSATKSDGTCWSWGLNTQGQLGNNTTTHRSSPVQNVAGGTNWSVVSAGNQFNIAYKSDGTIWSWGFASSGSLGDNTTASKSYPTIPFSFGVGNNWIALSCGSNHNAAIKTDGTLWCWGNGINGKLGTNTVAIYSVPTQEITYSTNWSKVSAGYQHTGAIKTDGTAWCWGLGSSGQIGDGTTNSRSSPTQVLIYAENWGTTASKLSTSLHGAAIKTDGTLWTWGRNYEGQLGTDNLVHTSSPIQTITLGSNWSYVSCGYYHMAAIKKDGTLWTWGRNNFGQLGLNDTASRSSPIQVIGNATTWSVVSCGYGNIGAIKTDGTLWVWGDNTYGKLGIGTLGNRSSPVQVIGFANNWSTISIGFYHSSGIKTDGTLWCWGYNYDGRLGDNTTTHRSSPVQTVALGTNWSSVSCGKFHTAAVKTDGTLWTWGANDQGGALGDNTTIHRSSPVQTISFGSNWSKVSTGYRSTYGVKTDGTLWCWGLGATGQLGNGASTQTSSPVQTSLAGTTWSLPVSGSGSKAVFAIKTDGTLWSWGDNTRGLLADNSSTNRNTPVQPIAYAFANNWSNIACATNNTVAVKSNNTLWAWGINTNGSLGTLNTTNYSFPQQIIGYGTNWSTNNISNFVNTVAAIKTDGTLWTFGTNSYGQLGEFGFPLNRSSPIQTFDYSNQWQQVSAGNLHTMAIKQDGTLWGFGSNAYGQLGTNNTNSTITPVQEITGSFWKQVIAGSNHTAAIKVDNTLWLWGSNISGEIGDNTLSSKSSPVQTVTGGTWSQLSCGSNITAAIKSDGSLWTWGANTLGQLGDNTIASKSSPVQTISGGNNWSSIKCGLQHIAGIKTDGTLWIWGINTTGQLGDNTVIHRSSPVQTISAGTNWKVVTGTNSSTVGIKTDGSLWLWGFNTQGQLGNSTTTHRSSPVQTIIGGKNWKNITINNIGSSMYAIRDWSY